MSELSNYSIESDHTVVLAFKDGRKLRVPVGQLPNHLDPLDLEKIRSAIKLRREFIRRHMPKVAVLVVAGGLIALLTVGGGAVAQLFWPPQHPPVEPNQSGIVRNEIIGSPSVSPSSVTSDSTSRTQKLASRPVVKTVSAIRMVLKPLASPLPTTAPILAPTLAPDPSPTPTPTPAPSPSASPAPSATDSNGKVAGCAVTPTDPAPDCSMQ